MLWEQKKEKETPWLIFFFQNRQLRSCNWLFCPFPWQTGSKVTNRYFLNRTKVETTRSSPRWKWMWISSKLTRSDLGCCSDDLISTFPWSTKPGVLFWCCLTARSFDRTTAWPITRKEMKLGHDRPHPRFSSPHHIRTATKTPRVVTTLFCVFPSVAAFVMNLESKSPLGLLHHDRLMDGSRE